MYFKFKTTDSARVRDRVTGATQRADAHTQSKTSVSGLLTKSYRYFDNYLHKITDTKLCVFILYKLKVRMKIIY